MKKLVFSFITLCMLSISAQAQSEADVINSFQTIFGMEKKAIVESFVNPSPDKEAAFWEVYSSFDVATKELGKKRIALLQKYADSYGETTDDQTNELVGEMISITKSSDKLVNKYYKKLKKISPVDAAAFYQVETYITAKLKSNVLEQIPYFGEFE